MVGAQENSSMFIQPMNCAKIRSSLMLNVPKMWKSERKDLEKRNQQQQQQPRCSIEN